ncbi:unnamed protein product [Gadus morhua 'NCC']
MEVTEGTEVEEAVMEEEVMEVSLLRLEVPQLRCGVRRALSWPGLIRDVNMHPAVLLIAVTTCPAPGRVTRLCTLWTNGRGRLQGLTLRSGPMGEAVCSDSRYALDQWERPSAVTPLRSGPMGEAVCSDSATLWTNGRGRLQ